MGFDANAMYEGNSKWLKANDLKDREHTLRINRVTEENLGSAEAPEKKLVCWFDGKEKGLGLNKTNAGVLIAAFGGDTDGWISKEVIVYPTTTEFQGQSVPCIRLRKKLEAATDDDDLPF